MTIGYILVLSILVLGGVIATIGDRLGTKVGKARLSLFNLRPRQTAVVITIITGTLISGSTLAILFTTSKPLRRGVFEYDETQRNLHTIRQELEAATEQKQQVEKQLTRARTEQAKAQSQLDATNRSLQDAVANQKQTAAQLNQTSQKLSQVNRDFQASQSQLQNISKQTEALRSEITQLQKEQASLIQQRDEVKAQIAQRDEEIAQRSTELEKRNREIAQRDQVIAQREALLKELEDQQTRVEEQVARLLDTYQDLRRGEVVLSRGQILASAVVRVPNPSLAQPAIDQLLREANRNALRITRPGTNLETEEQIVQIPNTIVRDIIQTIDDGQAYFVRVISAGNFVVGEPAVVVSAEAERNRLVFSSGEVLTSISIDSKEINTNLQQRLDQLILAAQFRARQNGVLSASQIDLTKLVRFVEQVRDTHSTIDIQITVEEDAYTSGPLKFGFTALQDGRVLFRS